MAPTFRSTSVNEITVARGSCLIGTWPAECTHCQLAACLVGVLAVAGGARREEQEGRPGEETGGEERQWEAGRSNKQPKSHRVCQQQAESSRQVSGSLQGARGAPRS